MSEVSSYFWLAEGRFASLTHRYRRGILRQSPAKADVVAETSLKSLKFTRGRKVIHAVWFIRNSL